MPVSFCATDSVREALYLLVKLLLILTLDYSFFVMLSLSIREAVYLGLVGNYLYLAFVVVGTETALNFIIINEC